MNNLDKLTLFNRLESHWKQGKTKACVHCENPLSENEQAILLDVEAKCPNGKKVILHLKSKLDNYTIDKETNTICVNDIKTIGKIVSEIDSNIERFRYNRELGKICPFSKQLL